MDDRARERTDTPYGGLNDRDLGEIRSKAGVSQDLIASLGPYFDELIKKIHSKWEGLSVNDGAHAKLLKFQLLTVVNLKQLMVDKVNAGKILAKKTEIANGRRTDKGTSN